MSRFLVFAVLCVLFASFAVAMPHDSHKIDGKIVRRPSNAPKITQKQVIQILMRVIMERSLNMTGATPPKDVLKGLPCSLCTSVVGWLIDHANDWACDYAFDAIAAAACLAAGLGPENPWADVCVAAMIEGCNVILGDIEDGITNPTQICQDIDLC